MQCSIYRTGNVNGSCRISGTGSRLPRQKVGDWCAGDTHATVDWESPEVRERVRSDSLTTALIGLGCVFGGAMVGMAINASSPEPLFRAPALTATVP